MLYPTNWSDYELIDAGNGRKLERFGDLILNRPEPAATFPPGNTADIWQKAGHRFEEDGRRGTWDNGFEEQTLTYPLGPLDLRFLIRETGFKHTGLFPEQAVNWQFITDRCTGLLEQGIAPKVLNLFAYTGGASLAAAVSGSEVTHVDSVKSTVNWAAENAALNHIDNIRWIVEDAATYVQRLLKRGEQFHGIIMDPPIVGLGPKGKRWKLKRDLPPLLSTVFQLLHPEFRFFILNTYSPQLPLPALKELIRSTPGAPNNLEFTRLGLKATSGVELSLGELVRSRM